MKLKNRLKESTSECLREIADFWGVTLSDSSEDHDRDIEQLVSRMQSPSTFKAAFEKLEVGEREIVYFLALHGGELPVEEFRRRMELHDDVRMEEICDRLQRRGFIWRGRITEEDFDFEIVSLPEPLTRMVELPPYWKGFLGHYLNDLGLTELKHIAQSALGRSFNGKKKQALSHFIRNQLLDPTVLRERIESQSPAERELFQQILQKNGACVWRDLLDGGTQKKFNHARADTLDKLIRESGLVYVWQAGPNKYNNMVMVPRDLSHVIHNAFRRDERTLDELNRGSGPRSNGTGAGYHPNVILDNTHNIVRDLAIFLAYVRCHDVKMLNNGGMGRNDLKKIAPLLSHNKTTKYVSFLALFAMSKKLLVAVGDQWRVSKGVGAFLKDSARVYRDLYEFWLTTNEWNEEYLEGDIVHVDNYPQNLIGITELRKLILRVLENVPSEAWIDFDTFAESLLPQIAIEIPGRFDHSPAEKSNRHTTLIIEAIIAESLYWLGLVTLGVQDLDTARELGNRPNDSMLILEAGRTISPTWTGTEQFAFCFKPSTHTRQLFGGKYLEPQRLTPKPEEGEAPSAAGTHFTVESNLDIVVPPDLDMECFYRVLAFSEVKKVDIMTTLTLTRESLRMGMERGLSGDDILLFLKKYSRRELPETVIHLIEECGKRHGEVDVGLAGGYILAAEAMHVEEFRANPRIQRYIKDVFGERLILLNRTLDLKKLTQEIQKMGFLPHVSTDALRVTSDGLFHITLRPEELYAILAVLQFCQALEEEHESKVFEERLEPLIERLGSDLKEEFNAAAFIEPLRNAFRRNFEKGLGKRRDEEQRKLKKQVNRLLERMPKAGAPERYPGENPTSDSQGILKMLKYAIEREKQVKIHYVRSTGEKVDEVIEPESLQGDKLYAYCPDHDEHHVYSAKRIAQAAL